MARKQGMKPIHILVTDEQRTAISDYAKSGKFKVTADYIRKLIQDDMVKHGVEIDLSVDRGGFRERKDSETDDAESNLPLAA